MVSSPHSVADDDLLSCATAKASNVSPERLERRMAEAAEKTNAQELLQDFLGQIRPDSHDMMKGAIFLSSGALCSNPSSENAFESLLYALNAQASYSALSNVDKEKLRGSLNAIFSFACEHRQAYKEAAESPTIVELSGQLDRSRQHDGMSSITVEGSSSSTGEAGSSHPHIKQVLAAAERDLDNADYKLGFIFNPLRALVVRPAMHVAKSVLPPLANRIPIVDDVMSNVLQFSADACKIVYHATHSQQGMMVYPVPTPARIMADNADAPVDSGDAQDQQHQQGASRSDISFFTEEGSANANERRHAEAVNPMLLYDVNSQQTQHVGLPLSGDSTESASSS